MTALVILLSDLHDGKTDGGNSSAQLAKRLRELPDALQVSRAPAEVWPLLIGDLVEGEEIFPTQNAQNEHPSLDQVKACSGSIETCARGLHRRWPRARVCMRGVRGNHGRLSRTAHPSSNLDLAVMDRLGLLLRDESWCSVAHGPGISRVDEIGGLRVAQIHRSEKHAATNAMLGRILRRLRHYRADIIVAGHWHAPGAFRVDGRLIQINNGAACDPDEYAEQLGMYDPAAQAYLEIDGGQAGEVRWVRW